MTYYETILTSTGAMSLVTRPTCEGVGVLSIFSLYGHVNDDDYEGWIAPIITRKVALYGEVLVIHERSRQAVFVDDDGATQASF